jgi:hypothetical protein
MQQVWQNDTHQDWQQQSMPKGFHFFFGAVEEGPFQMPRNVASVRKKTLLRVRCKMYNNTEDFCRLQ